MAETWEQLAEARKRKLEKHGKTAEDDYPDGGLTASDSQIGAPRLTGNRHHDWQTRPVSRGDLAATPAARFRKHEVLPGTG